MTVSEKVQPLQYLEAVCSENANVSRHTVTKLDLDNISPDQLFGVHVQFLTFTDHYCKLHSKQQQHALITAVSAYCFITNRLKAVTTLQHLNTLFTSTIHCITRTLVLD